MNKLKTPDEIQDEIDNLIDSFPLVKPDVLLVGDSFVISCKNYRRVFGSVNAGHWIVLSKAKTLIRFGMCGDTESAVTLTETFKGAARDHTTLRRASSEDAQKIKMMMDEKSDAVMSIERRRHHQKDRYILWNHAFENVGPEATGDFAHRSREGFVLEVYDGNGQMQERVRMLTDSDAGLECADNDAIERMVRAYAASYFNREDLKKNAKFHIQHIPQMD